MDTVSRCNHVSIGNQGSPTKNVKLQALSDFDAEMKYSSSTYKHIKMEKYSFLKILAGLSILIVYVSIVE